MQTLPSRGSLLATLFRRHQPPATKRRTSTLNLVCVGGSRRRKDAKSTVDNVFWAICWMASDGPGGVADIVFYVEVAVLRREIKTRHGIEHKATLK